MLYWPQVSGMFGWRDIEDEDGEVSFKTLEEAKAVIDKFILEDVISLPKFIEYPEITRNV